MEICGNQTNLNNNRKCMTEAGKKIEKCLYLKNTLSTPNNILTKLRKKKDGK